MISFTRQQFGTVPDFSLGLSWTGTVPFLVKNLGLSQIFLLRGGGRKKLKEAGECHKMKKWILPSFPWWQISAKKIFSFLLSKQKRAGLFRAQRLPHYHRLLAIARRMHPRSRASDSRRLPLWSRTRRTSCSDLRRTSRISNEGSFLRTGPSDDSDT